MKIKLSDHDRFLALILQRDVPWTGGEAGFAGRFALGEALALEAFGKTHGAKDPEKLSHTPTYEAKLAPPMVDLLIVVLTGGPNGGVNGNLAPAIHRLVSRIRVLMPKAATPE